MKVRVSLANNESCDDCGQLTREPVVILKWREMGYGNLQLWLHKKCLEKLLEKVQKLEAAAAKLKGGR